MANQREPQDMDDSPDIVFLEGIPSSGKTSVSGALRKKVELDVIHGDDLVKKWMRKREFSPAFARQMFTKLLDVVEKCSVERDVIVDMTIPAGYLLEARTRFPNAVFVSLRVDEEAWSARERKRNRKPPLVWNDDIASQQAPENDFDLVVDTSERTPEECADVILAYFEPDEEARAST